MNDLPIKPRRKPKRNRPSASVSMTWELYDRLDRLAAERNVSVARVVDALLTKYEKE